MLNLKSVQRHHAAIRLLRSGLCSLFLPTTAFLLPCRAYAGWAPKAETTSSTIVYPMAALAPMMTNLLANSDFEKNSWMGSSGYSYGALPTGWWSTNKIGSGYNILSMAKKGSDFTPANSSCGTYAAVFQVQGINASIGLATAFSNLVSGHYKITYFYAGRLTADGVRMEVYVDDLLVDAFDVTAAKWLTRTVITPALAAGGHRFRLVATNPRGGDNSVSFDSVSLVLDHPYAPIARIAGLPAEYAQPEPGYGEHYYGEGDGILRASVGLPWTNGAETVACNAASYAVYDLDGIYLVRTNKTTAGAAPQPIASGSGTCVDVDLLEGSKEIDWNYSPAYFVALSSSANGSLNATSGWRDEGDVVTVTATPDVASGLCFHRWVGDVPETINPYSATLSFAVTGPCALQATYGRAIHVATDGNDAADGLTRATAVKTVARGVALAGGGDTVLVHEGTYAFASTLRIATNVVVRGATGKFNDAILDAQLNCRAVTLAHTNAVLADLTVKRGWGASCGSTMTSWGNAGGCVRNEGGEVRHCRLTGGSGSRQCAGVGVANLDGRVIDCTIDGNTVGGNIFGGLGILQTGNAAVTDRTIVTNNIYAFFHTGALPYTTSGILMLGGSVRNSLIAENSPGGKTESGSNGAASGVIITGGTLENCAIVRNTMSAGTKAATDIGAVVRAGGTIVNCLIRDNPDPFGLVNDILTATPLNKEAAYCCLTSTDGIYGGGNIAPEAPGYIYNPRQNPSFRLTLDSPMKDAATRLGWMTDAIDMSGNPRIGGLWPDIGPSEIDARMLDCVFSCGQTDGETPLSVTFKPDMAGASTGNCDYYWTFRNRISGVVSNVGPLAVLETPTYTHVFGTGVYDVTLEVRDRTSGKSKTYFVPDLVCARPLVCYVNPDSAAPAFPYDSWATAATNVADTLDRQIDGMRVILSEDVHPVLSEMVVTRQVSIEGVSPETTTFQGKNSFRLFRLSDPGAVITGVKLTGGRDVVVVPTTFADPGETYDGLHIVGGGGAVWLDEGGALSNCVIEACTGVCGASGIGVFNDSGRMTHCIVRNFNVSGCQNLYGAAIRTRGTGLVTHTVVSNIVATGVGYESPTAAVHIRGGTLRNSLVTDCRFTYSSSREGNCSAVRLVDANSRVDACTIAGNEVTTSMGAAVRVDAGTVSNSIVALNVNAYGTADWYGALLAGGTPPAIAFTLTSNTELLAATNVAAPPVVFSATKPFHLPVGSPAIDAGAVHDWMASATDLGGRARLRDGTLDLGAFAYVPSEFGVGIAFEGELESFDRVTLSLVAQPTGNAAGAQYYWLLDGAPAGTGETYALDSTVLGDHVITLAATNAAQVGAVANLGFTVIPRIVYVQKDNPGSKAPYGTWETACSTFAAAVAAARSGATVLVADGDYRLTAQCPVSLPITIKSLNGPYGTVISGNRTFQLIRLDHAGAVLDGFLMTNGLRAVYNNGATVRKCRFTGNTIGRNNPAMSLYNDNGRVENCEFFGDRRGLTNVPGGLSDITYGSLYQTGDNAVTERCSFHDNYFGNVHQSESHWAGVGMHMLGGTVRTSLFYENGISNGIEGAGSANRSAAGLFMTGGRAANCTFVDNYSLIPPESETGLATNVFGVHAVAGLSAKGITTPGAVKNCLFLGNANELGMASAELYAASGVAVNCRLDALSAPLAAQGCIGGNPLFRDYAGRDFRLRAASPCARAGLRDEAWMNSALDFGGAPIMCSGRMPIGCFSAQSATTMLIIR